MEFISEELNQYCLKHTAPETELLQKINRDTMANVMMPRMLSGHLQGRLLAMISQMIRPKRILEIGTYTGYSALCMAEGLSDDGKLVTIDKNEELEEKVRNYFGESQFSSKINFLVGNAQDIIPELAETWDLVFIDADKRNYSLYLDLVADSVRVGGFMIADNVLWSGKVLNTTKIDSDTKAIMDFNIKVQASERFENILLPVRDGIMTIRKVK